MTTKLELYPYQREGIKFLKATNRALLADEMGLGKTAQAIVAARELGAESILVVCPKTPKFVWQEEFKLWWPEASTTVISGTPAQRSKLWEEESIAYITNYQSLLRDVDMLMTSWDVVIYDEAHRLRNRRAKSFVMAKRFARGAGALFELTGTPIVTDPENIWTLLHLLDPVNHTSYWRFVKYYCDVFWNGFNMTIGALLEGEELAEHLAQYCIRRTKEVLGDQLPSKTVQQVWVDFAPKDQRRYDRMVKEYVVFPHGKDAILALNVISSIMYCKQMAICPDLLWEELDEPLWGPKADAILDILDSLGPKPCVIFTNSAKAATRTSHLLLDHGINSKVLSGETSKYAADIVMGFQRGAYQVLICTILAGGPGITLIAADTAIFIDKHWAPAWNEQAQDRLHRIGQKHPVTIIEILARNTIDERLEEILQARSETAMEMYTDSTQVPTKVAKLLQKALDA